jgi:hypothetical protein
MSDLDVNRLWLRGALLFPFTLAAGGLRAGGCAVGRSFRRACQQVVAQSHHKRQCMLHRHARALAAHKKPAEGPSCLCSSSQHIFSARLRIITNCDNCLLAIGSSAIRSVIAMGKHADGQSFSKQ